ncbi:trans-aconitate 2-methyltransferase [Actibacterium atlanticum]|uniref:Trans-aconitate 2-methyltransferase n=1 Tax=Actibacterium atlanticum TaxID=1461693 RepID=A0A058ZN75_9RHOB|nr:methyltransferase domain-containing protein [Actibacterium atlanticum]KCV83079.1 trans-aconitate 2-methyltransferase [Actibacterium atlanticum]
MSQTQRHDWNPETYARFRGLRLRPAMDLLAQVEDLPGGPVVDMGCGAGAVGAVLKHRFAGHSLMGVDSSPAMLEQAEETGAYDALTLTDAVDWHSDSAPALIFSNALCHWLPDHETLFAGWASTLAKGGTLAVQMPRQYEAPSHSALRLIAANMYPDRFDFTGWRAPVSTPEDYQKMLSPLGQVRMWETTYFQTLCAVDEGHPVRHFSQSTAMRPFLAKMSEDEQKGFVASYDGAMARVYPLNPDGSAVLPFRRLFFTLKP